jgi:hypothetical protein
VAFIATTRKGFKDIQKIVKEAYGDKAFKHTQIYDILKKVKKGKLAADQQHLNTKRKKRSPVFINIFSADIDKDQ